MRGKHKQQKHVQDSQKRQNETQDQAAGGSHVWRYSSLLGYPLALALTAGAFALSLFERYWLVQDYLVGSPFVMATLVAGWFWGLGPALFALGVGILALDYWVIPPTGTIDFFLWPHLVAFLPILIIQLVVLGLLVRQKKYRQQLVENNARLSQANQVKDQFLALASHELRTPLTTMQGQVQLALLRLARRPLPPDFAFLLPHLEKVAKQTRRLSLLVNDLLNLSSLRSGKMPLRMAPCDLCLLCRQVVEDQGALTDRSIHLQLPPQLIILHADESRISQVVTNLVVNALKYSPVDSTVSVKLNQGVGLVQLAVYNAGPVLSQERREHLFEPFYRTPEAQASPTQGWGLGLAISKEIVEQHGGRIWVESEEGEGITFLVELPYHQGRSS